MTKDSSVDPETLNGPHLSAEEFDEIFQRLKTWGEYPPETIERGALNFVTEEIVQNALKHAIHGLVIPTALGWNTVSGPDNTKPALHYMTESGDVGELEPTSNKDFIGIDFHGKASTHMDAMTHIVYKGQLFGGKISSDVVHSFGSAWSTIDKLGPIVSRGILLDAARFQGSDWLEPGTAVREADVLAMEEKFGFRISQGDIVLLRTGHFARREQVGVWNPNNLSAGFHVDVMNLFKERKVAVIGGDGDSDVRPSPVAGVDSPIHVLALPGMGIPLLDNLQLEALGQACAIKKQWTFLMTLAPLNIPGGTGSPLNPIAVL